MNVEIRIADPRLAAWGFPYWGSELAAGLDLHACLDAPIEIRPGAPPVLISSGAAIRIGEAGWCGLVVPRSGLGHRGLVLGNTVGVIDADYEGTILMSVWNRNAGPEAAAIAVAPGDRIAQIVFVPVARPRLTVVGEFSGRSVRAEGGFGSTGGAGPGPET